MALKLNVGISRMIRMPDYGSAARCAAPELELDAGLLECDSDGPQARTRHMQDVSIRLTGSNRPRAPAGNDWTPSRRPATASQVRVILAIARRRQADLREVLREEFDAKKPEELSLRQASRLIDRLKAVPKD